MEPDLVAGAEVLKLQIRELRVRNRDESSIGRPYARRSQAYLFDDAYTISKAAGIADPNWPIEEEGETPPKRFSIDF